MHDCDLPTLSIRALPIIWKRTRSWRERALQQLDNFMLILLDPAVLHVLGHQQRKLLLRHGWALIPRVLSDLLDGNSFSWVRLQHGCNHIIGNLETMHD